MEIKKIKENELVLWSRPKKIKEHWYNAILEKPAPTREENIQFIMRCNYNELSYIVVSIKPLTEKDIDNINLDNYVFDTGNPRFSQGLPLKEGVA